MLTGQKPHRFSSSTPLREELARILERGRTEAPQPARARCRDPTTTARRALDHIVLVALRTEPARRYTSAADFAQDIRHYLAAEAVLARPDSVVYRVRRYVRRNKARRLRSAAVLLLCAAAGAGAFHLWKLRSAPAPSARVLLDKSIAVLPFANLSTAPENAFFAAGVQNEILTDLARISDLKVIGRSSVEEYASGAPRDLPYIGQQLGVAHLLEGSVERADDRVRLTVRLIESKSGAQLWAESYERELADVFAIQNDIAQAVVRQLQAKLLPEEKAGAERPPTRDVAAYDRYLRAKTIVMGYLDDADPNSSLREAIELLDEAVERDPGFALAYCFAARAHGLLFGLRLDRNPARAEEAERAVQKALTLEPASPEVHLALAEVYYRCGLGLDRAAKELEIARPGLPNSSHFYVLGGSIYRRLGQWEAAERSYAKAVELDPRNSNAINLLADNQVLMRRYEDAARTCEKTIASGVGTPFLFFWRASIDFAATGDEAKFRASLAALPAEFDLGGAVTPQRILMALAQRDYDGAARILAASPRAEFQEIDFTFFYPRSWYEALIARAQGDAATAREGFAKTRSVLEEHLRIMKADPKALGILAQVKAGLGEKDAAIHDAEHAARVTPVTRDAYDGAIILQSLAQVYTWTGETSRALEVLEKLTRIPGYLSYGALRHDPAWAPLRGDRRFAAVTAALAPPGEAIPEKSIAVLPFQNLSAAPENAFLAAGVQDAVLTDLAKISGLRVINHSSVQQYASDAPRDLRAIGAELRVAYVLEGSVQRTANRIRVTARLSDARTSAQTWAKRYEEALANFFGLQDEIAREVAGQLRASISPEEHKALQAKMTDDLGAYHLFLQARGLAQQVSRTPDALQEQLGLLEEAVARDPAFVPALCTLAQTHLLLRHHNFDQSPARLERARQALEAAARIAPEAGEVYLTRATFFYWGQRDYASALAELAEARRRLPNEANVLFFIGVIQRRQGRWEESMRNLEAAAILNPRSANLLFDLALSYFGLGRFEEAARLFDSVLAWRSEDFLVAYWRAFTDVASSANLQRVREMVTGEPAKKAHPELLAKARIELALLERDYRAAEEALAACALTEFHAGGEFMPREWYEGVTAEGLGNSERARAAFRRAREAAARLMEANPDDARALMLVAEIEARLGRNEIARLQGERAVQLLPVTEDAVLGPSMLARLAGIYARIGEHARALDLLEQTAGLPFGPNFGSFKLEETWDPLRQEPRFEKLLVRLAPRETVR